MVIPRCLSKSELFNAPYQRRTCSTLQNLQVIQLFTFYRRSNGTCYPVPLLLPQLLAMLKATLLSLLVQIKRPQCSLSAVARNTLTQCGSVFLSLHNLIEDYSLLLHSCSIKFQQGGRNTELLVLTSLETQLTKKKMLPSYQPFFMRQLFLDS